MLVNPGGGFKFRSIAAASRGAGRGGNHDGGTIRRIRGPLTTSDAREQTARRRWRHVAGASFRDAFAQAPHVACRRLSESRYQCPATVIPAPGR